MADQTLPPQPERPDPPYYAPPPVAGQPRKRPSGSLVAAIVGSVLLLVVVTVVVTVMLVNPSTTSGPKPAATSVGKSVQAVQLCQQEVLNQLKSPRGWFTDVKVELANQAYYVTGSVDSQDGVRSDWTCQIFAGGEGLATPNVTIQQHG